MNDSVPTATLHPSPLEAFADLEHLECPLADGRGMSTLSDALRARVRATPDLVAVRTATGVTTFGELAAAAARIANGLLAHGVAPGDRVAVLGPNGPEMLAAVHAVTWAGAVPAVINHLLSGRELREVLADCRPSAVVLGAHDQSAFTDAVVPAGVRLVLGREVDGHRVSLEEWSAEWSADDPGHVLPREATALMLYTSGTTGLPKGVELTGHNLSVQFAAIHDANEMTTASVAMAPLPFFHIAGLGYAVLATINGAELLMVPPTPERGVARLWAEFGVSHAVVVPALLQALVRDPAVRVTDWSRLEYLTYGASAMTVELIEDCMAVFGCRFLQGYGLTETTGGVTMLSGADHASAAEHPHRLLTVGRAIPGSVVKVVDPFSGEERAPGEDGEIWVGGHQVMRGYWGNGEASGKTITPDGWLRTGDVGSLDEDGYLTVRDRLTDMIISGGENVYPAEVERALALLDGVLESAVVGVPSERWGETPHAFVVVADGVELTEEQVLEHCRGTLARFKVPSAVTFMTTLPRNATGKIRRAGLRG